MTSLDSTPHASSSPHTSGSCWGNPCLSHFFFYFPPPNNYTSRPLCAFEVNIGLSFTSHVIHSSFFPSRPSPSILRLCDQGVEPLGFLSAIGKVSESLAQTHKLYSRWLTAHPGHSHPQHSRKSKLVQAPDSVCVCVCTRTLTFMGIQVLFVRHATYAAFIAGPDVFSVATDDVFVALVFAIYLSNRNLFHTHIRKRSRTKGSGTTR